MSSFLFMIYTICQILKLWFWLVFMVCSVAILDPSFGSLANNVHKKFLKLIFYCYTLLSLFLLSVALEYPNELFSDWMEQQQPVKELFQEPVDELINFSGGSQNV